MICKFPRIALDRLLPRLITTGAQGLPAISTLDCLANKVEVCTSYIVLEHQEATLVQAPAASSIFTNQIRWRNEAHDTTVPGSKRPKNAAKARVTYLCPSRGKALDD